MENIKAEVGQIRADLPPINSDIAKLEAKGYNASAERYVYRFSGITLDYETQSLTWIVDLNSIPTNDKQAAASKYREIESEMNSTLESLNELNGYPQSVKDEASALYNFNPRISEMIGAVTQLRGVLEAGAG